MSDIKKDAKDAKICGDDGTLLKVGDTWSNVGIAIGNLFGIGGIIEKHVPTPLDKLNTQISNLNSDINDFIQTSQYELNIINSKALADINDEIKSTYNTMLSQLKYNDEILQDEISTNQIYIAASFLFIIIFFIYYLLFNKN